MPTFHARLIRDDQKPLAGAVVRVIVWSLAGRSKTLVEGKTDGEGTLELAAEFDPGVTLLPRLGVQLRSGSSWRDLGETPVKVSREWIEFGTLVVSDAPALLIGTRKIYAVELASVTKLAQAIKAPLDSKLAEPFELAEAPVKLSESPLWGEELPDMGNLADEIPFELPKDKEGLELALLESFEIRKVLDAKLLMLDGKLLELDNQLDTAKLQLDTAKLELDTAKLELDKARDSLVEYEQASPLVDVVQDLGSQLGTAAKSLDQAGLGMVLGDVSISLKGVSSGAGKFEFPTISKLQKVAGAEMSTIGLAFYPIRTPQLGTPAPEPEKGPGMPNLLGYTELLARRKLEPLQLAVEVSHKAIGKPDKGPSPWGRVVEQSPAPGGAIVPGSRVEILIGKPIDEPLKG